MLVGQPADWLVHASSPRTISTRGASAYLKIAEGCNRTCSFCVIPQLRGKQRSRSIEDVVAYVQTYVPGYRPTVDPQFSVTPDGTHRVAIFVEVEGAGDFFPPYAGNLDIMTAAATQVGNQIAQHMDAKVSA